MDKYYKTYINDRGYQVDASRKQKQLLNEASERCYHGQSGLSEDAYMKFLYPKEHNEYIVDGAVLQCNQATKDVKILKGSVYGTGALKKETTLIVTNNPMVKCCRRDHATIADCKMEENVKYFHCNCNIEPDSDEEWTKLKNDSTCKEEGTCKALMNLNEEWDNLPAYVPYLSFTDDDTEEKPGITMSSILFCKHGGIISPIDSGQVDEEIVELIQIFEAKEGDKVSGKAHEDDPNAEAGTLVKYDKTTFISKNISFNEFSYQRYLINHENVYVDDNSLVRMSKVPGCKGSDDYYCVAMAQGFSTAADEYCTSVNPKGQNRGHTLQVCLKDTDGINYSIDVVVFEAKASDDVTDFFSHDHIVEFFVDGRPGKEISTGGNVDYDKLLGGNGVEVTKVYAYKDGAIITDNNGQGKQWEDR